MTKQEKIREGIAKFIAERSGENWDELPDVKPRKHYLYMDKEEYLAGADQLLGTLHSQGVVIKVDRELPKCLFYDEQMLMLIDCPLYNAGYVAVGPLIKEQE